MKDAPLTQSPIGPLDQPVDLGTLETILARLEEDLDAPMTESAGGTIQRPGWLLDTFCDRLYDALKGHIPYDRIGLALLDPGDRLRARWMRAEYEDVDLYSGWTAPLSDSLRRVLETGEPRIINDLRAYGRQHPKSVATQRILYEGIHSNLTCPLSVDGQPVGVLFFSSRKTNQYRDAHIELFRAIAERVSRLIQRSRRHNQELDSQAL